MPRRRSSHSNILSHGANVNTLDVQHSGVVGHAADMSYVTCVRLLLEAGADPDIASAQGFKVGNPLNVAARNASDLLVLKTLLEFGASIDSCGIDGMIALIHASRKDNVSFATLLLEYGANINAASAAGQTPLTTAVAYNSHSVLRLLLDRWFEHSECPRLTGPHLFQIAALYADIETITILTDTNHFHLKYDSSYALGDFMSRLSERPDATDKLILAFDGFIDIIKRGPPTPGRGDTLGLMKSSLAYSDAGDSDGDMFENAMESFHPKVERPTLCRYKSRIYRMLGHLSKGAFSPFRILYTPYNKFTTVMIYETAGSGHPYGWFYAL